MNDPIFTITDLLPHLAQDQMKKKLADGIDGEDLNVLIGSIPYQDKDAKEKVKLNILNIFLDFFIGSGIMVGVVRNLNLFRY